MIGIHNRPGSFSDRWIAYCREREVPFKIVNAYDSDIVSQLAECRGFMWHWHFGKHADQLFARQLALALQARGMQVFPDTHTAWHYDDKLGQKYLLEALNLPLAPVHVFYEMERALAWLDSASYPIVFKLRGGAGSRNVRLIKNVREAKSVVRRAFASGFPAFDTSARTRELIWRFRRDGGWKALSRIPYWYLRGVLGDVPAEAKHLPIQKGYVYFQEFIPHNAFDQRFIVIGNRCLCIQRAVREGDFRASGSGQLSYTPALFPKPAIALAFRVAESLKSQSVAIDIMYDRDGRPLIGEVSYGFPKGAFAESCPGYFDRNLGWNSDNVVPEKYIIEDFVRSLPGPVES